MRFLFLSLILISISSIAIFSTSEARAKAAANESDDNLGPDILPKKKVVSPSHNVAEPREVKPSEEARAAPVAVSTSAASWRYFHFSAYIFGDTGNHFYFPSTKVSDVNNSYSGSADMNTSGALGFGLETWHSEPHSWGWSAGISYDGRRTVSGATLRFDSFFIPDSVYSGSLPSFTFLTVYGNAIYRVERWYFPFGFNFTIPELKEGEGDSGQTSMKGSLGTQGGAGYHITDNMSVEALLRLVAVRLIRDDDINHYDLGTGYMGSLHLNVKFDF